MLGVFQIHGVHQHARAGAPQQRERRLLHDAGVHLPLAQRFQQIDPHGRELDFPRVDARLLEQVERQRMVGVAERGNADGLALQVLHRLDAGRRLGRGDDREQRQPSGHREPADVGADIGIGLDCNVERGGAVIDGPAEERLHGRVAAAGIDKLHVEAVVLEMAGRARDLVGHAA